jgi:glycosyltransferase involved in cell wall biosynthesis
MRVSIIVPIYNAEKYLERCLDSLLSQTYKNIEIILIDDGSTDSSPLICDRYKKKYKKIKVLHSKNNGQSIARNIGMNLATGKYICFADADDVLTKDSIERLIVIAEIGNYDIVCGNYFIVDKDIKVSSNVFTTGKIDKYGCEEHKKRYHQLKTTSLFGYVWGKMYKSSFIQEHKLKFNISNEIFMEDTLFNLKTFSFNPKYYVLNEPIYYYYFYKTSTSNKSEDITTKAINMLKDYNCFLLNQQKYDDNIDLFVPLACRVFCWVIIKKIFVDGVSFYKIRNIIKDFMSNDFIKVLFFHKRVYSVLSDVPSTSQKMFYNLCIFCFRFKLYNLLAFIFICIYPLARIYINKIVKR